MFSKPPLWPFKTLESFIYSWWKSLSTGNAQTLPANIWDVIFFRTVLVFYAWNWRLHLKADFTSFRRTDALMCFLFLSDVQWLWLLRIYPHESKAATSNCPNDLFSLWSRGDDWWLGFSNFLLRPFEERRNQDGLEVSVLKLYLQHWEHVHHRKLFLTMRQETAGRVCFRRYNNMLSFVSNP